MFRISGISILLTVTATFGMFAAAQLPDGDGKALIEDRCTSCHDTERITTSKHNKDEWTAVVDDMVALGATMDDKETQLASQYLAKFFGPAESDSKDSADPSANDKAAQELIAGVCSSCHDSEMISTSKHSKQGWTAIVQNMNDKGAGLSANDTQMLADYLFRTYPDQ